MKNKSLPENGKKQSEPGNFNNEQGGKTRHEGGNTKIVLERGRGWGHQVNPKKKSTTKANNGSGGKGGVTGETSKNEQVYWEGKTHRLQRGETGAQSRTLIDWAHRKEG